MANSCHTVNNWCYNCTKQSFNGIIRNSKFYCSEICYDRANYYQSSQNAHLGSAHKKVHFGGASYYHPHSTASSYLPTVPIIEKQCNYCFDKFDIKCNRGIDYGPMWFCCQHHLNLANPRPKVMMATVPTPMPALIHVAPQVLPHVMGQRIIGPFIGGPFIRPF